MCSSPATTLYFPGESLTGTWALYLLIQVARVLEILVSLNTSFDRNIKKWDRERLTRGRRNAEESIEASLARNPSRSLVGTLSSPAEHAKQNSA